MKHEFRISTLLLVTFSATAAESPEGYRSLDKTQPILDATPRRSAMEIL